MKSFLMIGQSNMAGRGHFDGFVQKINPACSMLRMGNWRPLREPANPDRPVLNQEFHSGVSMATDFADTMQQYLKEEIGMIPCADGGTRLCQWMPGEILYDHAVMMTGLAKRTSEFTGIIWHQGESDCEALNDSEYRKNLPAMLTALRKDLGDPALPLVLGEISPKIDPVRWKITAEAVRRMNQIIRETAELLPNCAVVKTDDLEIQNDGIHFSAAAQEILGKRYAEKMIDLLLQ